MVKTVYCIALLTLSGALCTDKHILSDEYINNINNQQSLWKAGRNFHPNTPLFQLKSLMGVNEMSTKGVNTIRHVKDIEIPESFDARIQWPNCTSIREIADQSACGSCWAVSSASCMSDRLCIASNGQSQLRVSAANILSCCEDCGYGCWGGQPYYAYHYWAKNGIVTGGLYNSSMGCQNYPFPSCDQLESGGVVPACGDASYRAPDCVLTCDNSSTLSYNDSLTYGDTYYEVEHNDVEQIQLEILKNGPVTAILLIYADFLSYKSGIYSQTSDDYLGRHAVRMLGWGVENNVPYWLVANSWNADWGDNGLFKIIRGKRECVIESQVSAGTPKL